MLRLVVSLILLYGALAMGILPARADERRVSFAPVVGARWFEKDLDLETDIAFGARLGMEMSSRWGVIFDFVASHPVRTSSGREVVIDAMRVLARMNFSTGDTRPYTVAGIGGAMFLYPDAANTAEGILTVGLGVDHRIASRLLLFAEGSADMFRSETVYYAPNGTEFLIEPRQTFLLGTTSLGLSIEF